jgi:hypothetical protein
MGNDETAVQCNGVSLPVGLGRPSLPGTVPVIGSVDRFFGGCHHKKSSFGARVEFFMVTYRT